MKIPPIRPCSVEEFKKLPQQEQFRYKVSGLLELQAREKYGIVTEPKNEYEAFGQLWARFKNAIDNCIKK